MTKVGQSIDLIGNVFHVKDIEEATEKGMKYLPDSGNNYAQKSVDLDKFSRNIPP